MPPEDARPDLLYKHGSLTARELTGQHRVAADPEFLQRALDDAAGLAVARTTKVDLRSGASIVDGGER